MPSAGLQFVVSTNQDKANPTTRKLIRSHVMVGKNRGRCLGPKKRSTQVSGSSVSSEKASKPGCRSATQRSRPTIPPKVGSELSFMQLADNVEPRSVAVVLEYFNFVKKGSFPVEDKCLVGITTYSWSEQLAKDPALLHALIFMASDLFGMMASSPPTPHNARTLPHFLKTVALIRERIQKSDATVLSESTISAVMALVGHAHVSGDYDTARHHLEGARRMILMRGGIDTLRHNTRMLIDLVRADIGLAIRTGLPPLFGDLFLLSSINSPPFSSQLQRQGDLIDTTPLSSPPPTTTAKLTLPIENAILKTSYSTLLTLSTAMNDITTGLSLLHSSSSSSSPTQQQSIILPAPSFLAIFSSVPYQLLLLLPPHTINPTPSLLSSSYQNQPKGQQLHPIEEVFRIALLIIITTLAFPWDSMGLHTASICGEYEVGLRRLLLSSSTSSMLPGQQEGEEEEEEEEEEEQGIPISKELRIWFLVFGCISQLGGPRRRRTTTVAEDWMEGRLREEVRKKKKKKKQNKERGGGKEEEEQEEMMGWEEVRGLLKEVLWVDGVHDGLGRKVWDEVVVSTG